MGVLQVIESKLKTESSIVPFGFSVFLISFPSYNIEATPILFAYTLTEDFADDIVDP